MCKDIFSTLLENELKSENPNPAIVKYGNTFLERLNIIGNQLERILLDPSLKIDNTSNVTIMTDNQIRMARKGLAIMDIVESEINKIDDNELSDKYPLI